VVVARWVSQIQFGRILVDQADQVRVPDVHGPAGYLPAADNSRRQFTDFHRTHPDPNLADPVEVGGPDTADGLELKTPGR